MTQQDYDQARIICEACLDASKEGGKTKLSDVPEASSSSASSSSVVVQPSAKKSRKNAMLDSKLDLLFKNSAKTN